MELKCPEEGYVVGESVTVESFETEGALILTTPQGQPELVFPGTRTDVVAFKETDFILQGDPYAFHNTCATFQKLAWKINCIPTSHHSHREKPNLLVRRFDVILN
jgi:hypothetical protein